MRTLYHFPLDPASRQARIALGEAKVAFTLVSANPWAPEDAFLQTVSEGIPPALVEQTPTGGTAVIAGARAITEYAHDGSKRAQLLPNEPLERAEVRRLCEWFDAKFAAEVHTYLLMEKVEKAITRQGTPDTATLRWGREALGHHLDYIEALLEQRDWIGGRRFSLADIAAAGHLSCLDFLGEVKWRERKTLKGWYQKVKSRPSVQPLLKDRMPGLYAPSWYDDLDF